LTLTASLSKPASVSTKTAQFGQLLRAFLYGLILPFSFAPFHLPGAAILSLALFYAQLLTRHRPFLNGLAFGLGYFGLGISWIYISIHEYGHLNSFLSALITFSFLLYLSLFPALLALLFTKLNPRDKHFPLYSCFLFSALWVLFEYARSTFLSGFPWLLIGFGQFDAPLKHFLPILGVFGVGFLACFLASLLTLSIRTHGIKRYFVLAVFIFLLILPFALKHKKWTEEKKEALSIGVIQANLSMRDKWDENLFWQLLRLYKSEAEKLFGTQLIVMPESAIPLPPSYVEDFLIELNQKAREAGSAIVLGIPKPYLYDENLYFNALISLGAAKGFYLKQHLVPFGEYVPKTMQTISEWLAIPDANLKAGKQNQTLVRIHQHPIATLICYEIAYGELLRKQLPRAEWIVSISDDGWFGHSLAMYQHLQMAQVLSFASGRYQVLANNDGLSSVIDSQGEIKASLPAFSAGILKTTLHPATGITPWARFGDTPIVIFSLLIVSLSGFFWIVSLKLKH
jgi:apolipoprotein N-acyltransferase